MVKRSLFLIAILATVSSTFAQEQGISFGVRVGLNLNSATLSDEGKGEKENPMLLNNNIGFHAGVVMDIPITSFLYFQPGVMFTTKGGIIEDEYEDEDSYDMGMGMGTYYRYEHGYNKLTTNVYCIELPLMLSLKATLSNDLFLRANFGPYFDFGLSGTVESEEEYEYISNSGTFSQNERNKDSDSQDIYPSDDDRFINGKSINFGFAFGGGIEFSSFYVGVNYYYGITNVLDVKDDEGKAYDRSLGITLGYNF